MEVAGLKHNRSQWVKSQGEFLLKECVKKQSLRMPVFFFFFKGGSFKVTSI